MIGVSVNEHLHLVILCLVVGRKLAGRSFQKNVSRSWNATIPDDVCFGEFVYRPVCH